jgi:hypothetical protein
MMAHMDGGDRSMGWMMGMDDGEEWMMWMDG